MNNLDHITNIKDLFLLAISDFEKTIEESKTNKSIVIDLTQYHAVRNKRCHICVAGSIVRQTLKKSIKQSIQNMDLPQNDIAKLCLIDSFRVCSYTGIAQHKVIEFDLMNIKRVMLDERIEMDKIANGDIAEWKKAINLLK